MQQDKDQFQDSLTSERRPKAKDATDKETARGQADALPSLNLPKGGGAIRGIGEKFTASPVTGVGSLSVPVLASPGRSGFGPKLTLTYNSGSGNGPFGFGWTVSLPMITRKTDKGFPNMRMLRGPMSSSSPGPRT